MSTFIERPRSSCALGGALAAMSTLPRVVPVIHSALGCGGGLSMAASFGAGYLGSGYCSGTNAPSSGIIERDIVFGGTERLHEEITSTLELIDAELYIVATSCMTEIIGDDVANVVADFSSVGKPVISISTPSFKGDSYAGYEILLEGIFNDYLPVAASKDATLVNLFGLVPAYDPFFRGDLEEIARLLGRLGLTVNTFFTPDQSFQNIVSAPSAALNIVFSQLYAHDFAQNFEAKHGTPYWVTNLPIGSEATDRFLTELGEKLGLSDALVKQVIASENRTYYGYFSRCADIFCDGDFKFYSLGVTNSNYAIPLSSFLEKELGWIPLQTYITDQLRDEQKQAFQSVYDAAGLGSELIFETDTSRISKAIARRLPNSRGQRYFDDIGPVFIVGSSLEKELSLQRKAPLLSVSYPVYNRIILDRGYAGYRGGLHLFEDLLDVIMTPR